MATAGFGVGAVGRPRSVRPDVTAVLALLGPAMVIRTHEDANGVVARLAEVPGISSARLDTASVGPPSPAATDLVWSIGIGRDAQQLSVRTAGAGTDDALMTALDAFAKVVAERMEHPDGPVAGHDFVTAVCHALRGSLTSVIAFSSFLTDAEEGGLTEENRQFAEVIRRSGDRMLAVIDELALIARLESGELQLDLALVSVRELVRTVVAEQQPRARSAVVALRGEEADGRLISCDRGRVHQLLTNLVVNRLEVATPGGAVVLRAAPARTGWRIEVTSSGPGHPERELDQLFTAFHQASNRPRTGTPTTGLGLALSRAIAEIHGGTIEAATTGEGTTISVGLPWRRPGER
ncbi:sensor histidine kinase KdpD [Kribbella sp. VKM Ac-2566]|uniref:sensor histidine kinase n=1 Tax=Kribbella sp. VKM Ac-2566 TaxID=2512218 RepID=UPI0010629122|nr:HAMP domain-containing sensor histidine kinase [Kribbella sp. VKM Ac-2566]TDW91909.1 phospho-acceptor domain-containing protein [Kribbella sp. VKM Ac-2566]